MWRYHHVFCCELDRINARLTTLNLLYLGLIALIPFPHRADRRARRRVGGGDRLRHHDRPGHGHGRGDEPLRAARRPHRAARAPDRPLLVVPGVFIASIPIAAIDAEARMYSWLALPVLIHLINRRQRADESG
jgi:hypothetical protein